ncbi:MAG: ion transporter [Planctomycetales bacterium]
MATTNPKENSAPIWKRKLRAFLTHPLADLTIGILIVASVGLTLLESMELAPGNLAALETINKIITAVFVVELALRWLAAPTSRRFFSEYWLDILAAAPILEPLGVPGWLRLLRLLRLFRLMGLFTRYVSFFPYVARRGLVEYCVASGVALLTVLIGSSVILLLEKDANPGLDEFAESFWFSTYTLFAV